MTYEILTKWGENIDSNNVLPEYPRPQFQRDSYINLNGYWDYCINGSNEITSIFDGKILVPFSPECPLSGVKKIVAPTDFLHYNKTFHIDENFNKGRVFINFGAVDQIAKIYVNNVFVGEHIGGYTPFTFEISDQIKTGNNNLYIIVQDLSDTSYHSRGKQKIKRGGIWYSPQSGIWQTVWLESTPKDYLESVYITPDIDNSKVDFKLNFIGKMQYTDIKIYDNDKLITEKSGNKSITIKLNNFKFWSPESPFLYNVEIHTENEIIKSYFAMRKFSICKDKNGIIRLALNNKPYFHNGVLDQGYYSDGYLTPPSDEAMKNDILTMKEMGFNMLRKHIKVEPLRWYYHCDKIGMLVWQDMINGGEKYGLEVSVIPFLNIKMNDTKYKNFGRENQCGRDEYIEELKCIVKLLYNSPAIAMWVPFNEGWGEFESKKAYELLKTLDKTRLVDSASGWHDQGESDIISKHIYFTPIKVKRGDKPFALSEFGGLGLKIINHTFNSKIFGYKLYSSKNKLNKAYEKLYRKSIINKISKGLSATVYTQLSDVEDELNGFLTYDRKVNKFDVELIKKLNSEIKIN